MKSAVFLSAHADPLSLLELFLWPDWTFGVLVSGAIPEDVFCCLDASGSRALVGVRDGFYLLGCDRRRRPVVQGHSLVCVTGFTLGGVTEDGGGPFSASRSPLAANVPGIEGHPSQSPPRGNFSMLDETCIAGLSSPH